ncbi:hypothetical protein EW146_g1742 [Bondarzewia mesenterica]|uniref:DUF1772 domain-containing protein n=1 Tax=Bondarzewia mesenterica TaxID=1095465 RepID=A0A4S4M3A5_9AGAM|nr:hypothetical protein EW146_g1742 [Bondarzewia mesenterica]
MSSSVNTTMPFVGSSANVATAVGLVASGMLSGGILSSSVIAGPALFLAASTNEPNLLARQWETVYTRGRNVAIPLGTLASSSFLYTAYAHYAAESPRGMWEKYAVAGALCIAIVPFTLTVMKANVRALQRAAKGVSETAEGEKGKERELSVDGQVSEVVRWIRLNFVRALFPLTGFGIAVWLSLQ